MKHHTIAQNVLGNSAIAGKKTIDWNKSHLILQEDKLFLIKILDSKGIFIFNDNKVGFQTNFIDLFFFDSAVYTHFF